MSIRDKIMEKTRAEKDMGCWHWPEFTKGCWGSPHYKLCWLCKVRYPIKMAKMMWRVMRK